MKSVLLSPSQNLAVITLVFLSACSVGNAPPKQSQGLEIKFLVGSALQQFCEQAATQFNQTQPKLDNNQPFYLKCEPKGSGDVVNSVISLSQQLKNGTIKAEDPQFPTLISVDGEVYQSQLIQGVKEIFPTQQYIPEITDSPLLAYSPMVFMASSEIAPGLRKQSDIYQGLLKAKTHKDLDPTSPVLPINYVQTSPVRSNSGLQALIAQFASVSGKRPEQLTVADVQKYQPQIQAIQSKVTRYGVSTHSLASSMVTNGPFWASIGSVYESSVIEANSKVQTNTIGYEAIYPQATFTSNMRAILPNAPWISPEEKAAAEKVIEFLRSPQAQKIATDLGLRPGVPGVELGPKFSAQYGVDPQAKYDSLRPPSPEVVAAMLSSWQQVAKKPSKVVLVVDSSGSMKGNKLPSVQNTLKTYLENLGPKDQVVLIDFDSQIRPPVLADSTPAGRDRGLQFVANLQAEGGTKLYDAALYGRDWLAKNLRPGAINAVVVLTDGEDSGSSTNINQLTQELQKSGFASDQRIAFFTIGYGNDGEFNPQALQQIAQGNGGYYLKGDPATIANLMSNLQVEF